MAWPCKQPFVPFVTISDLVASHPLSRTHLGTSKHCHLSLSTARLQVCITVVSVMHGADIHSWHMQWGYLHLQIHKFVKLGFYVDNSGQGSLTLENFARRIRLLRPNLPKAIT